MRRTTRVLALATVPALLLGVAAAPAAAEHAGYRDPADTGGASLNDIRRVTVDHRSERLVVRVKVIDLRRRSEEGPAGMSIRIDTRSGRKGPEYRLSTGLNDGTDYQLMRIRHGHPVGGPLSCDYTVHLGYHTDVARFEAARDCLGSPHRLRVGVKVTDLYDGSHPVTDWLGEPRSWTRWLSAG